jgi:surface polysaccharide O-acyltransferase-like enzyme
VYQRRHDVDWLRVLALGLLIIFHITICFQSWAVWIAFIQNESSMEWLWVPMSMLNIWRIPLLFMISGMGVCFAMQRRNWHQLLRERATRILIPLVFGFFFICPITIYLFQNYYRKPIDYVPNAGHLWFLENILAYVLLLLPILSYLKNRPENFIFRLLSNLIQWPLGLILMSLPFMAESWIVNPNDFSNFAMTDHGFWYGLVAFFTGFLLVSLSDIFWKAITRIRHIALAIASSLFLSRIVFYNLDTDPELNPMLGFESFNWMMAVFGYGAKHLNKPSKSLSYLSAAVFPIYILHLPVQQYVSSYLLPLDLPAFLKLVILILATFVISWGIFHYGIRKIKWLRPLFGLRISSSRVNQ